MSASSVLNTLWERIPINPSEEIPRSQTMEDPSLTLLRIFKGFVEGRSQTFNKESRRLIERNIELAFWGISEEPELYRSFSLRVDFAEIAIQTKLEFFADRLLQFFSEEELVCPPEGYSERISKILQILSDESTDSYFQKTKMYLEACRKYPYLLKGGGEAMAHDTETGFFHKMDTPKWRYVGRIVTTIGFERLFKMDWDFDATTYRRVGVSRQFDKSGARFFETHKNDSTLTAITFPAIIESHLGWAQKCWWGQILGFSNEEGYNGRFITLPEPETILSRWNRVLNYCLCPPGIYRDLKIVAVPEGTLSTIQFLEKFFENDVIVSMSQEYVHDHTIHVIRTINAIMTSKEDAYLASLGTIRTHLKNALSAIQTAREEGGEEEALLYLLELCLGMFADTYLSLDTVENRNELIGRFERANELLKDELRFSSFGRWWPAFGKMGGAIDHYTIDDVQNTWNRIILNKPN